MFRTSIYTFIFLVLSGCNLSVSVEEVLSKKGSINLKKIKLPSQLFFLLFGITSLSACTMDVSLFSSKALSSVQLENPPTYINRDSDLEDFPIEGTCPKDATNVTVKYTDANGVEKTSDIPCVDGKFIGDIDITELPDGKNTITIQPDKGKAIDWVVTMDGIAPSVTLSSSSASPLNSAFTVTATFSEEVIDFTKDDISITNGIASGLSVSGTTYTFTVTPTADFQGVITVDISAGVAEDKAGNKNTAAISLTRTHDSIAPVITGLTDDSTWVKSKTWNWGCDEMCTYRYVVDTNESTIPSGTYSATTTATQNTGSGKHFLHLEAMDGAGNTSLVHISVNLDNAPPSAPTVTFDGEYSNILINSPVIRFTDGSDEHSGIARHEARIVRESDNAEVTTWAAFTSEGTIAATLETNTRYRAEVRAVDKLGNISSIAQGDGWLADKTSPAVPTGLAIGTVPKSLTSSPTLSWTPSTDGVEGSGISHYEVQIEEATGDAVVAAWQVLTSGSAINGLSLTKDASYIFKVRAHDRATNISEESVSLEVWKAIECPEGYIKVPKLTDYTNQDFCVAKYEMKNVDNIATSQATGDPWVNIQRGALATTADSAWKACKDLGTGYDLISNAQWQTIARNIETVKENWSGGAVGNGTLNRGWSANSYIDDAYLNEAIAPSTDSACLYNTAADTCGATGIHLYRRTHILTNGNEIWDFSGNVAEWIRDNFSDLGAESILYGWHELSNLSLKNKSLFSSVDVNRNSAQGIGQVCGTIGDSPNDEAIRRGGYYQSGRSAGVFEVMVDYKPSDKFWWYIGFRCVFVP